MKKLIIIFATIFIATALQAQTPCIIRADCSRTLLFGTSSFPLRSAINQPVKDTVVSVAWQQLKGTSIISGGNGLNATVSTPTVDSNIYSVTAKTVSGKQFVAFDTVIINSPLSPVVTITGTQNVTNTIDTLIANAVDPNIGGSIVQWGWGKLAGPGVQTILGASTPTAIITGLQNGTYTFKCTVWSREGLTGSATYTLNVVMQKVISKIVIYFVDGTSVTVPVNQ